MPKPWIEAADKAGPLPQGALDFLTVMLVPVDGKLVTVPPETWQGMWRLAHMAKALDDANSKSST